MTSIITWPYVLRYGNSRNPAEGACAMDAINWLVHGKHGDAPECACPVIRNYVISGNDLMPDNVRQRLLPYLSRIAGSKSEAHQMARTRVLQLGALRVFAPRALDAAGLHIYAAIFRELPDDVDIARAQKAAMEARDEAIAKVTRSRTLQMAWAARAAWAAGAVMTGEKPGTIAAEAAEASAQATGTWDDYFFVLDQVLAAGPQGEPWSVDTVNLAQSRFISAGGQGIC